MYRRKRLLRREGQNKAHCAAPDILIRDRRTSFIYGLRFIYGLSFLLIERPYAGQMRG